MMLGYIGVTTYRLERGFLRPPGVTLPDPAGGGPSPEAELGRLGGGGIEEGPAEAERYCPARLRSPRSAEVLARLRGGMA